MPIELTREELLTIIRGVTKDLLAALDSKDPNSVAPIIKRLNVLVDALPSV